VIHLSHVRRAAAKALAVLLASMVSLSAAGLAHNEWDDGACDPIPVHHDHNAHRFRAGTLPTGAQDHCLFCHSLRSLGNGLVATNVFAADTAPAATVRSAALVRAGRLLDSHAPSRAPPALL
jgi:hypothetical protein